MDLDPEIDTSSDSPFSRDKEDNGRYTTDSQEFVANIPIRDAPEHDFRKVYGVENYVDLSSSIERPVSRLSVASASERSRSTSPISRETSIASDRSAIMAGMGLNIVMVLGSVRENRMCDRVAKYVQTALQARNHHVMILDPKNNKLGQVVQPIHFYQNPADIPKEMKIISKQIQEADAFVVLAAEYNSAISPALCSLMDNFPPATYQYRPSAIVTYSMGQFGGIRSAMQLRQYLSELLTVHVPSMIVIPRVQESLNDQGVPAASDAAKPLKAATDSTISQLEWYADALKKQRASVGLPK